MKKNSSKEIKSIKKSFGLILQQLRKERGLSQEDLGYKNGYHRTYISLLERGQKSPSLQTIFQMAKALSVTPSEIISRVEVIAKSPSKDNQIKKIA